MNDLINLQRFVDAQESVIDQVLSELRAGRKQGHWMWFIFPQLRGLGHSAMANHYGIESKEEAEAYLSHPVLGRRLNECTQLVNAAAGRSVDAILGYPDNLKFRSSMTLFALVAPERDLFRNALENFFDGKIDDRTADLLKSRI